MSSQQRYPTKRYRRTALLPAIVGAVATLAGIAAIGGSIFTVIQYVVAIFALILLVISVQARHWWWALPLAAIAVAFNPVFPFHFADLVWTYLAYATVVVFLATGILVRVVNTEDRNKPLERSRR